MKFISQTMGIKVDSQEEDCLLKRASLTHLQHERGLLKQRTRSNRSPIPSHSLSTSA